MNKFNVPWWVSLLIAIALYVVASVISIKWSTIDNEVRILSAIIIGIVLLISSLIAATVVRFKVDPTLKLSEDNLREKVDNIIILAKKIESSAKDIESVNRKCEQHYNNLDKTVGDSRKVLSLALDKLDKQVVTYRELLEIEANVGEKKQIWVLTSALILEDDDLRDIIRENFKKGIQYTYLIPKDDLSVSDLMKQLIVQWKNDCNMSDKDIENQIKVIKVPKHWVYMTVVIYDPINNKPPTVLVKLPTSKIYEQEKYPLIYKVDSQPEAAWRTFVDAIRHMIELGNEGEVAQTVNINDYISDIN